jgi:periplasmic protein TonB
MTVRPRTAARKRIPRQSASSEVLPVTMAISIVAHAFILLITFSPPDVPAGKFTPQLDVVLVNTKSAASPVTADVLAQANVDGGGNVEADRRAKSNLPVVRDMDAAAAVQLSARRVEQLEEDARRLLELAGAQSVVAARQDPARRDPVPERADDPVLDQQQLMIARLEAEIAREWEAYQKLPRRKFIGARAEGVVYAEYVDGWRRKIEKVGTENFPDEARRRQLYGTLLLTVSIKADGSVEKVEIERSSGHRVLDTAATRIVDLAGPFSPFPDAIRAQYDVLSITRSWSFTRSDLEITVSP